METNNSNKSSAPLLLYERIEARDDGYLFLVGGQYNSSDGQNPEQQPLLLHAANNLMKQLKEKLHKDDGDGVDAEFEEQEQDEGEESPPPEEEDEEEPALLAEEGEDNDGNDKDDDDVQEEKGNEKAENKKNDENTGGEENISATTKTTTTTTTTTTTHDYDKLERTVNLVDRIQTALTHIRLYKHDNRKKKRNGGDQNYRENKVKALRHQRERLQQQQKQRQQQNQQDDDDGDGSKLQQQSPKAAAAAEVGNNNGKKVEEDNEDNDDNELEEEEEEEEQEQPQLDPHVRLVRTLNSIRAITPILREMMFHKDMERKDLVLNGGTGKKRGGKIIKKTVRLPTKNKKPSWWLLGNHVFDFASSSLCKSIRMQLQEVLEFFLPYDIVIDIIDGKFEQQQQQQQSNEDDDSYNNNNNQFWCHDWLQETWGRGVSPSSYHLESPYDILLLAASADASAAADDDDDNEKKKESDNNDNNNNNNDEAKAKIIQQCQIYDKKFFSKTAEDHSKAQQQQQKYDQSVRKLHHKLSTILQRDFPGSRLSVYGSCKSNLSLKGSDVDLSLFLPQADTAKKLFQAGDMGPESYERTMTGLVRDVWRRLVRRQGEFFDMIPVTRARVPVVKGSYIHANNPYTEDGSLHFDICFLNDIAVANSDLLRQYSLFDESVRELMVVVKKWAKDNHVCSAQDNSLSSYAWLNMVVFYLQCLGFIPNLQCPKLMKLAGLRRNPDNYWHNVNDLDTCYLSLEEANMVWKRPDHFNNQPIISLLYGFFHFYSIFGFKRSISMISIKRGNDDVLPKTVFRKCSPFFCIEDPFETYDSHMPHDLGIPVNEPSTRRIFDLLQLAEEHLREHLTGGGKTSSSSASEEVGEEEEEVKEMTSLWPPPAEQAGKGTSKKKKGKNMQGGGRRRRGRGGRGVNNTNNNDAINNKPKQQQQEQQKPNPQTQQNNRNNDQQKGNPQTQKQKQGQSASGGGGRGGNKRNNTNQNQKGRLVTQEAGQNPAEKQGQGKQHHHPPNNPNRDNIKGGGGRGGRGGGRGGGGRGGGRGRGRRRGGGSQNKPRGDQKATTAKH